MLAAAVRQHGGSDAIGLGQLPEGFGEAPGAVGPRQHGFAAAGGQGLMPAAVVAPGGLKDRPLDAVPLQPGAQRPAAEPVVGEAASVAAGLDMRIEPTLADIDAGGRWYSGRVPGLLLLGLGLVGLTPLHPFRARGTGCDGPSPTSCGAKLSPETRSDPSPGAGGRKLLSCREGGSPPPPPREPRIRDGPGKGSRQHDS